MNNTNVSPRPIVLVSGADTATGLMAAKALFNAQCDVWGVTDKPMQPCAKSRRWQRLITVGDEATRLREIVAIATEAKDLSGQKPFIVFSQDDWVMWCDKYRDTLLDHIDFILPCSKVLTTMMDKTAFHHWALAHSIAVPESDIVCDVKELLVSTQTKRYPYIIKPLVRSAVWNERYPCDKFITVNSAVDLKAIANISLFECSEKYLVQEWIEGRDSDVYFCLFAISAQGQVLAEYGGRKLLQWPRLGGSTACCVSHSDDNLLDQARALAKMSQMTGLCSVEYKYDQRTDTYKVTEPTIGRNDYQSYLANIGGVNLVAALIEDHFSLDRSNQAAKTNKRALWLDEIAMLRVARQLGFRSLVYIPAILAKLFTYKIGGLLADRYDWTPLKLSIKKIFN